MKTGKVNKRRLATFKKIIINKKKLFNFSIKSTTISIALKINTFSQQQFNWQLIL